MTKKRSFSDEFDEALKAGGERDYKKAIRILESLAARGFAESSGSKTGHPEIYLYLARSWHMEKQFTKAASCARYYVRLRPEDGSGWFFLGRAFLADGAVDRAITALRRSLDIKPDSVDARVVLGTALLKKGKTCSARKMFEDALTLQPDNKKLRQGYFNALFVESVKTFKKGNAELARQMLTFLINNDVDGVAPRLYLAHALRSLGYFPEALEEYRAAQSFAPDDAAISWYAVSIYIDMGDFEKATQQLLSLGESVADAPGDENQISPRFVNLRILKHHLDSSAWAKAVYAGRNYIKAFGEDPAVHSMMGEAQRNLGNAKNAVNHFNLALKMDSGDPAPYYGLMLAHSDAGNWRALEAVLPAAEACGCDAESVRLYRVLCAANLDGDPVELLPEIQEAVRKNGVMPRLLIALARTYFRIGLMDLAASWYQKVLYIDAVTKLSPGERDEAMRGLFASYAGVNDSEALLEAYKMCVERWEVPSSVRKEYIKLLAEKELWARAAEQTERLLRYEDDVFYVRQLAKYRRNAGQYRQAAVLYRNMLREKPGDKNMLSNLVFCLDRMGERASAVNLIHEANRIFPPTAESLLIESRLYLNAGKTDKALDALRRVTDLFADDVRGWEETAAIYRKKRVFDMAEVYGQKARDLKVKAAAKKSRSAPRPSAQAKKNAAGKAAPEKSKKKEGVGGANAKPKAEAGARPNVRPRGEAASGRRASVSKRSASVSTETAAPRGGKTSRRAAATRTGEKA